MQISRDSVVSDLRRSNPPFIGRKSELLIFGQALERARAGLGSVVLVSGEAGIGKSALSAEFSDLAHEAGAKVLASRAATQFREARPFAIWRQIIGDQPLHDDARSNSGADDLDTKLIGADSLRPSSDDRHQPELLEKTARTLVQYARKQPLVLLFDDLYAADPPSLNALRVLARDLTRIGTVVVGIYRHSESGKFQEFADLLIDPLLRDSKRIALAGFDEEETRQFAQSRCSDPLEGGTLEKLHLLTEGNPRLLDIALRHDLLHGFSSGSEKRHGRLFQAEMQAHLEYLSAPTREVLRTASLGGLEFRLSSLVHVLNHGPEELLDSLHEAEQYGLLKPAEVPGTYRFRQKLVHETLCAEVAGARRARLHKRYGEVLEALHPQNNAFLEKIAHHFYEAALLGCAEKAADYCSRAAAQAHRDSRIEDAARFYHMAMTALEFQGSNPDGLRELTAKLSAIRMPATSSSSSESDAADVNESGPRSANAEDTFRKEGDFWTLIFQGRTLRLKHSNGLLFIAQLLQHPEREFHVAQLVSLLPGAKTGEAEPIYISRSEKERLGIRMASDAAGDPLLDTTAKAEYRRRIEELRESLEEAKSFNDLARAADLERELDFIGRELSRAVGTGGRDRKHRQENERARVNVTNSIRTVTRKIAKEHASFARFLRLSIQTGRFCCYHPDPGAKPSWRF